jgi:aminoglycoside 2''-phosphotransferase
LALFNVGEEKPFGGYNDVDNLAKEYLEPNLSHEEYESIVKMLKSIESIKKYPQPSRLTHGDIAPKHLIWDFESKAIGFIDFSDRSISDPALDFAELYTYGEDFVSKVYQQYNGPDKGDNFLIRARAYLIAIGVNLLVNNYRTDKTEYDKAVELLEIGKNLDI